MDVWLIIWRAQLGNLRNRTRPVKYCCIPRQSRHAKCPAALAPVDHRDGWCLQSSPCRSWKVDRCERYSCKFAADYRPFGPPVGMTCNKVLPPRIGSSNTNHYALGADFLILSSIMNCRYIHYLKRANKITNALCFIYLILVQGYTFGLKKGSDPDTIGQEYHSKHFSNLPL